MTTIWFDSYLGDRWTDVIQSVAGVTAWYDTSDWRSPGNMKKHPHVLTCILLLLPLALGLSLQEDDLVFDDVGEDNDNDNLPAGPALINHHATRGRSDRYEHGSSSRDGRRHASRVERAWGVSDSVVPVGHVFKMKIPRQAFSGNVDFYEVSRRREWQFILSGPFSKRIRKTNLTSGLIL